MPEKRSFESHISADLPIKDKAEDRLNRSGFAEALANVIRSWRDKPSLVIGLFGDWGSGKSSLNNLVLESIAHDKEKSLYIVEFSPWQVSGQELLSETFFREIGRVLGETDSSEETRSSAASPGGRSMRESSRLRERSLVPSGWRFPRAITPA